MKKTVIFYYSGTGNTWYVANKIKQHLTKNTGACEIASIENLSDYIIKSKIKNADIIGFGYPIYASDLPLPMKEFMKKIKIESAKEILLFCTQEFFSGDGCKIATEFLDVDHKNIRWAMHFNMPNNICCTNYSYTNDKEKINKTLKTTDKKIKEFCIKISQNTSYLQDFDMKHSLLGKIQRPLFRKFYHKLTDKFSIDQTKCSCCGICSLICPVQNIIYKNSKYIIKKNCALCMRCYNFCPNEAITYNNKPRSKKYGIPYRGPTSNYIKNLIDTKRVEKLKIENKEFLK